MIREYRTAAAFKQALEARLRQTSTSSIDFARRRQLRVKDLPDLALLATAGSVEAFRLRTSIDQTFDFRDTHKVPEHLPPPPTSWEAPYRNIASEDQLQWHTLDDIYEAARAFLEPVLAGLSSGSWEPLGWSWKETD